VLLIAIIEIHRRSRLLVITIWIVMWIIAHWWLLKRQAWQSKSRLSNRKSNKYPPFLKINNLLDRILKLPRKLRVISFCSILIIIIIDKQLFSRQLALGRFLILLIPVRIYSRNTVNSTVNQSRELNKLHNWVHRRLKVMIFLIIMFHTLIMEIS